MGAEQSSQGVKALEDVQSDIQQQEGESKKEGVLDQKIALYQLVRGSSESGWEKVAEDFSWRYYDMNEDGRKPEWMLEIPQAQIDEYIRPEQQFTWDFHKLRATFLSANGKIWAMKFNNINRLYQFRDGYQNRLFENVYAVDSTDDARTKVFGDYSCAMMNNNQVENDRGQYVVGFMDWEEDEDDADVRPVANYTEQAGNKVQGSPIKSIKIGAGPNSYLVRGSQIDVLNNQVGGINNTDVSFCLTPLSAQKNTSSKSEGQMGGLVPEDMLLMKNESSMGFLSSKDECKVYQADVESERVVAEWQFQKDGVEVPMCGLANDSKDAQLDDRTTFLGLAQNRLARWDMRDPHGAVQDLTADLCSPIVQYVGGKDYASKMHFSCMATSGDGYVVVGGEDGNLRLYNNKEKSLNRASTQIPGLKQTITAVDVTFDAKWIVATTDQYLMVVKTTFKDSKEKMTTGFASRMGKNAPMPRLLKLKPEDAARVNQKAFHDAKFTWITEGDQQERWIVASCGNYTLLWNFSKVKRDQPTQQTMGLLTVMDHYHLIPKEQNVVDSVFMHARYAANEETSDPNLVVATDHDVWTLQNE